MSVVFGILLPPHTQFGESTALFPPLIIVLSHGMRRQIDPSLLWGF
jgi:hypothetical protein